MCYYGLEMQVTCSRFVNAGLCDPDPCLIHGVGNRTYRSFTYGLGAGAAQVDS